MRLLAVRNAYGLTWTEAVGLRQWELRVMEEAARDAETMRTNRARLT